MEGFEIPMGADFSAMQAAFDAIIAAVNRMGDRIVAALDRSSAAALKTSSSMGQLKSGSTTAGNAAEAAGQKADGLGKKLVTVAKGAIAVGGAIGGVTAAMGHVATIMTALSSNNFGTMLENLSKIGRGLKSAMTSVWGALQKLGQDKSLWKIAAGAALGLTSVLALRGAFRAVTGSLGLLRSSVTSVFRGIVNSAQAAGRAVKSAFSGVASLPGRLLSLPGVPLAGVLSAAGAMALLVTQMKAGGQLAGEMENLSIAFEALTGSGEDASKMLATLRENWLRTGVDIKQQAPSIQKFLALGFSQADALKLQNNILDIAGAIGMSASEASLLGTALAQVKAKGVVSMEELRQQIAEKGVPVFETLAAKLGVTQSALIKLVEDGKVQANSLISIFLNMEGALGKFRGGAERMGGTFLGLLSRVRAAWEIVRAEVMKPINDALKPILEMSISRIEGMMEKAKEMGAGIGKAVSMVVKAFEMGKVGDVLKVGLRIAILGIGEGLLRSFRGAVAFLATALPPIFQLAIAKIRDPQFWRGIGQLFEGIGNGIVAQIQQALGNKTAALAARAAGSQQREEGLRNIQNAGNVDAGAILKTIFQVAALNAKTAMGGPISAELQKAMDELNGLLESFRRRMEAELSADEIFGVKGSKSPGEGNVNKESPMSAATKAVAPAVMSLTRIGGGGFSQTVFTGLVGETRKLNSTAKQILAAVSKPAPQRTAVYG